MVNLGWFLGKILGPLIKTGLSLIGNVLKPLAKSVLVPLGLTVAASATDAAIEKKILGSGHPWDFLKQIKVNWNLMVFFQEIIDLKKRWVICNKLDEFKSTGMHCIALCVNGGNVTYFDNFGVEHIPKENNKFIRNKNITTNIYRIQPYNSILCGCFSIGLIDFMLKGKSLLDYVNLFSPNEYEKKIIEKTILKNFQ